MDYQSSAAEDQHRRLVRILIFGIVAVVALIAISILFIFLSKPENVVSDSGVVTITNPTAEIETNVGTADPIFKQCEDACTSGNKALFCDFTRRFNNVAVTCDDLATNPQYSEYNVKSCSAIDCNPVKTEEQIAQEADETCVTGLGGTWENPDLNSMCPIGDGKAGIKLTSSDNPPSAGQICCI